MRGVRGARVSEFTKDPNLKKKIFCRAGVGVGEGGASVSEFF